jgi:hypothetical protein
MTGIRSNEGQIIAVKHGRPLTPLSDDWLAGDIRGIFRVGAIAVRSLYRGPSDGVLTFTTFVLTGHMREQICVHVCPWPQTQVALTNKRALNGAATGGYVPPDQSGVGRSKSVRAPTLVATIAASTINTKTTPRQWMTLIHQATAHPTMSRFFCKYSSRLISPPA